ncbi:MAG: hypothetical protein JWL81_1878 [Verrucomicrobiales bacterium]|nr:hypothetical protein [Verrucomicrobiales bacterium]
MRYFSAAVWLVNGFWCKLLGQVPRHEAIAARILGIDAALPIRLFGLAEMVMALWILSRFTPRLNVWTPAAVILTMNALEVTLAPDLLLFGRANALLACLFVGLLLAASRPVTLPRPKSTV